MPGSRFLVAASAIAIAWFAWGRTGPAPARAEESKLTYPPTRRSDHVDVYHGVSVPDPYRWLEDPDSDESRAWIAAQNKVTFGFLDQIPRRAEIRRRLTELWDFERYGTPVRRAGRYFYTRNDGLQNQSVLYVADSLTAKPRELLDPNRLSEDGTVALTDWVVSDDGRRLAYGLAVAGSDWREWKVRDVDSGRDLEDHLKWIKFSGASWTPDHRGFYYSRYDEPKAGEELTGANYFQKLFYHRLGQTQDQDTLVYERRDQKEWGFGGEVTEDGRYLVITVWRGTERKNQIFYQRLDTPQSPVVELLAGFDAEYQFLGNDDATFYLVTNRGAPRRRLVAIDLDRPQPEAWRELVAQAEEVIDAASLVGDRFFVQYLRHAATVVKTFDGKGTAVGEVRLPGIGTAGGFGGRRKDAETFYAYTSFTTPPTVYRYDLAAGTSTVFRQPALKFDPADYETKQVFYASQDGTRVPMFLTCRRGLKPDGNLPTLLYGYGGFDISLTPQFSVANLVWLELGGLYAVPNLRGGGEYGQAWHEAGRQDKKQNVFDDFIAAAEWLVANGYTRREKLAIRGGSNGGLLVGAVMTQRPELFAAAVPVVGVLDMLRYHQFTIGWAWVSEFGSADEAAEFPVLRAYSPLHNLRPGTKYPATFIMTADHDDRVVPAHSFKFAAELQHCQAGQAPALIRIETRAGHGAGTPTTKLIESSADYLAFLVGVLNVGQDAGGSP